ncbi:MAG: invasion protein CiaB [Candidatus Gracilibacteria bacterium]
MNKQKLEQNIKKIVELYNSLQSGIHDLIKGVKLEGDERKILDDFCECVGIKKNEETRFVAYSRISGLRENALELYLNNNNFDEAEKRKTIDTSYKFVCNFHSEIQAVIISVIESKNLLTPFYLEIFKGVANVGLAFNDLFLPWRNHIVNYVNKDLENKFDNDSLKIMNFLNENNLFDEGHDSENADRSYSALVLENGTYISKSYSEVFVEEIKAIVEELDTFINKLSNLEDKIYESKQNYIDYLNAIKEALLEKNTNKLIGKWARVDEVWMSIKTPFQISHPLEFYEDKYRKAVAPEWDLRIQNKVFESDVENSIESMYEMFYDDIGRDKFKSSYAFSLANQKRVQLYLASPVLYYSSELTGLFSAQVVPNDEEVSKKYGKKIFAFPEMVLETKRSEPFMKISSVTLEKELLNKYRKSLFDRNEIFYKIYDIETIGHEYGHTLWLDLDTEVLMNNKTGVFKNIEEFKATTGGLVMYFLNESLAPFLKEELIIHHVIRCIGLLKYREVNEIEPYYCESLIHLGILFESGIIIVNDDKKIELNYSEESYEKLKLVYIIHYKRLIDIYLNKIDAGFFLNKYTIKKNGYYLPINDKIRNFVEYYYGVYKRIGNDIDESILRETYM